LTEYEKRVDALTVKDLQAAAKKYLNLQEYIKVVLYPESFQIPESEKKAF
jgi:predicted Zn-dependent peptidase